MSPSLLATTPVSSAPLPSGPDEAPTRWVAAAPFAAHARFLSAQTGLGPGPIARATGVPVRVVRRLLDVGSQPRRIRACDAAALLAHDECTLRAADRRLARRRTGLAATGGRARLTPMEQAA